MLFIANRKLKNKSGFTLIEAMVLLFIFSIITLTFYQVLSLGTRYIVFSKSRLGAIALANEKMEIARNLSYDNVGIYGGACAGAIPQDEDIEENGRVYHVHTLAAYIDDPYDGTLGGSPNDENYKDYKLVKITVSWNNGGSDVGSVYLLARFVPPGLEAATFGDGILSINIFSDQEGGVGVPQATVRITNSDLGFDETRQTDDSGNTMIVGVKESIKKYQISVSKSGYETVNTFPPYPDTEYNPVDTHASVVAGTLNLANIALNKTADLKIITQDYFGDSISNIAFSLKGGRKLGNEAIYPYSVVYNLDEDSQTNSSGEKSYSEISPGQYEFSLSESVSNYSLIETEPAPPFLISPAQDLEFKVKLAPKNVASILIHVATENDPSPFIGATIKLSNAFGYDEETTTDSNGSAFFSETEGQPLEVGEYTLKITADGYQEHSETINVEENQLSEREVLLIAN